MTDKILLNHGSGGKLMQELISNLFSKHFSNDILLKKTDSALIEMKTKNLAYTTDSYVVDPIFFPGGNIGKLAVCGTVNDLAVSGAKPLYLSCGFIIEEGLEFHVLEEIVKTMADEARRAGVKIVTGDTKVVNKGQCDKIFINTSGIGELDEKYLHISEGKRIEVGDKIIINGNIGDHGMAVMAARKELSFQSDLSTDCASLNGLISEILKISDEIKFMRDATRGGLATVLCEIVEEKSLGIEIDETKIPVSERVNGVCEMLGFDPLYIANEGKVVVIVSEKDALKVLETMQNHPKGKQAEIIGEVVSSHPELVVMHTEIGGKRIIDMLSGEQLPRIC